MAEEQLDYTNQQLITTIWLQTRERSQAHHNQHACAHNNYANNVDNNTSLNEYYMITIKKKGPVKT